MRICFLNERYVAFKFHYISFNAKLLTGGLAVKRAVNTVTNKLS